MAIKRGVDKAVEALIAELSNLAKPTRDQKEIAQIGTISANSDATIGNIIAEAMQVRQTPAPPSVSPRARRYTRA